MRGAGVLIAVVVAGALGLGCDDVLAKAQSTAVVAGMSARPDIAQLQAAAIDWLTASVTSSQFVFGVLVGLLFAEGGRFLLRGLAKTWGITAAIIGMFVRYRLVAAGAMAAIYYVAMNGGLGIDRLGSLLG